VSSPGGRNGEQVQADAASWHARMLEPSFEAEVEAFEAWLAADPAHPRAYAGMEALTSAGAKLPRRDSDVAPAAAPRGGWSPVTAMALAGIALIASVWTWQLASSPAFAAVSNAGPAVRGLRFADGTGVVLDANSEIATALRSGTRTIRIVKGRVRIDGRRSSLSLSIEAGAQTISARSALFDIALEGSSVSVATLQGSVAIGDPAAAAPTALAQGDAVVVDGAGKRATRLDGSWPASRMRFERAPLARVIEIANRLGNPDIVLASPDLKGIPVSGVLDVRRTRPLARKLGAALDLQVSDDGAMLQLGR
jgi:transmembrane sensor